MDKKKVLKLVIIGFIIIQIFFIAFSIINAYKLTENEKQRRIEVNQNVALRKEKAIQEGKNEFLGFYNDGTHYYYRVNTIMIFFLLIINALVVFSIFRKKEKTAKYLVKILILLFILSFIIPVRFDGMYDDEVNGSYYLHEHKNMYNFTVLMSDTRNKDRMKVMGITIFDEENK